MWAPPAAALRGAYRVIRYDTRGHGASEVPPGPYDFALDVGCAHGLNPDELQAYHRSLLRLLKPGAVYLLFAHLNEVEPPPPTAEETRRWLDEGELQALFAAGFVLERAEYGQTQVGEQAPWRSAWFWFRRTGE